MAYPFAVGDRPAHAESSGASAVAGGVLLLLFGRFPGIGLSDAESMLRLGEVRVDPERQASDPELADRRDLEPLGIDRDNHNAKHGYGRLSARNTCMAAADPVAQTLVCMGEAGAAAQYLDEFDGKYGELVSKAVRRWAARALPTDATLAHGFAATLRALRLTCNSRASSPLAEPVGQWVRQIGVLIRALAAHAPPDHTDELQRLDARLRALTPDGISEFELRLFALFTELWGIEASTPSRVVELRDSRARERPERKGPGALY
jgi:hypothetical protein